MSCYSGGANEVANGNGFGTTRFLGMLGNLEVRCILFTDGVISSYAAT
jgi:hypothetical protein